VAFGRISDTLGRVRLYNLGFAVFAVGSVLLYLVTGTGNTAALEIIVLHLIQAVGGGWSMPHRSAIRSDVWCR
jgi:MFS family permease